MQCRPLSPEFSAQMRRFAKKQYITQEDKRELVDVLLFEALKDTDFDYYYNYQCKATKGCKFHGKADFLIYCKSAPHVPFAPVFLTRKQKSVATGEQQEFFNISQAVGGACWAYLNMNSADPNIKQGRALLTNGSIWQMVEVRADGDFKKTDFYKPQKDPFNKIYYDQEMQSVILGLIRFAGDILTYEERELRKIMDLVDERKFLTEVDPETKAAYEKRRRTWSKWVPNFIGRFFY